MITIVITVLMTVAVLHAAFNSRSLRRNWEVIKQYRLRHLVTNLVIIGLVIGVAAALLQIPYFDRNPFLWAWSAVFGDGSGGSGSGSILFAGIQWKWYALLYLPVLLFALPTLAKYEEESYRKGTRNWAHAVPKSLWFGLLHLVMLIPLAAALALSVGGLWFTYQYFKGGVERSTVYHAAYNSILVTVLFVAVLFS